MGARWSLIGLGIITLATRLVAVGPVQDGTEPAESQKMKALDAGKTAVQPPDRPTVRLSQRPGFDDDDAYVQSVAAQVTSLLKEAGQASEPRLLVAAELDAANRILSHLLEPACAMNFLGIPTELRDAARVRQELDRIETLLDQAQEERESEIADGSSPSWSRLAKNRSTTLRAFAHALRTVLLPGQGDDAKRATRRAASALSPLLEDKRPQVAAAATFWQACLRRMESDSARARAVLAPALADPQPGTLPYAFYARLLRCRITAERGGYATAIALLIQIEERCNDWFDADAERADAIRTAQWIQLEVLSNWFRALDPASRPAERQWCADRMESLSTEVFGEDSDTLYRLGNAVPLLDPIPVEPIEDPSPPAKDD